MNNPKVSIIIPVYNGSEYLADAINSALDQTYKNIEVIIINDGSCDKGKTEEIALSYGEKVRYFSKTNGGVASALNFAISKIEGDYFSWLSHDDYYEKNKIEREINEIKKYNDEMTVIFSNYIIEDTYRKTKTIIRMEKIYEKRKLEYSVYPVMVGAVAGCTLLFNVKHFKELGVFNEKLRTVQDYDFWFKLFRGRKTVFLDEALMTVRWHGNQGSRTLLEYTGERDALYTSFIDILSIEEKKKLFGSWNTYICVMLRKFLEWGLKTAFWKCVAEITAGVENDNDIHTVEKEIVKGERSIYIFGAGKIGRSYAVILRMLGICLNGFIDNDVKKDGKTYIGLECRRLENIGDKEALIIVAMKGNIEQIFEQLYRNGFNNMISWEHLELFLQEHIISNERILEYIKNNTMEIKEILG